MEGDEPQEMHLFIPPYPYRLPPLPLRPYTTIRLPNHENEYQEALSPYRPPSLPRYPYQTIRLPIHQNSAFLPYRPPSLPRYPYQTIRLPIHQNRYQGAFLPYRPPSQPLYPYQTIRLPNHENVYQEALLPHRPPSLPLNPYQTIGLPNHENEHQEALLPPFPPQRLPVIKNDNIEPPFPWATSKRATVHTLQYLLSHNMITIPGKVECTNCHAQREIEFGLEEKFKKVSEFILENKHEMMPVLLDCIGCGFKNCMEPVICKKKRGINWLFLLLGEMIGCCDILQLNYFCKHAHKNIHVNIAQLKYFTYLGLCKQLQPDGPFDPPS